MPNGLDRKPSLFDRAVLEPGGWRVSGAVYSLMAHTAALTGLLVLALTGVLPGLIHPRAEVSRSRIDLSGAVFLPVLDGGSASVLGTGDVGLPEAGDAAAAYPGLQPIVSELSDPTSASQTLLSPDVVEREAQAPSEELPNLVQLRGRPAVVQVDEFEPDVLNAPLIGTLEAVPARDLAPLAAAPSTVQPLLAPAFPPVLPILLLDASWARPDLGALAARPPRVEPLPVSWTVGEAFELLSLSTTPGDGGVPVPDGEVRGAFAISPASDAVPDESPAARVGDGTDAGDGADGPLSGIRILAGGAGMTSTRSREAGAEARIPADGSTRASNAPGFLQRSYGVTVVTTESSGGGLPDFGVFDDEQVHTVFVDMRREADDPAPAWTVAYGVPQGTRVEPSGEDGADAAGFHLPFPLDRAQLQLPEETVARYYQRRVIAYAVIDAAGALTDIAVLETPAPALAGPVLAALSHWRFRPARLDGKPVAIKVLLGIPIWTLR